MKWKDLMGYEQDGHIKRYVQDTHVRLMKGKRRHSVIEIVYLTRSAEKVYLIPSRINSKRRHYIHTCVERRRIM